MTIAEVLAMYKNGSEIIWYDGDTDETSFRCTIINSGLEKRCLNLTLKKEDNSVVRRKVWLS